MNEIVFENKYKDRMNIKIKFLSPYTECSVKGK